MSADLPPIARVVVEAAVARFVGRPYEDNPFDSIHGESQHYAWSWAWRYADLLLERVGAEEAARWLEETRGE